ncbi:MAG: hypothetical protein FJZ87_17615 [Chloroflexi bacterium]|nr:hypothetical protein [Chloroflexota bacterium]
MGKSLVFEGKGGNLIRPDPWQNAGSVALQYYFSKVLPEDRYSAAIGPEGLIQTYSELFGNPWGDDYVLIPGSLQQPELKLPFPIDQTWYFTGGPHTGWGAGEPYAAIDFAPPSEKSGCFVVEEKNYATAMAEGLVVRSSVDGMVIDLDMDGDERTGWSLYYLHLANEHRAPVGAELSTGDFVGLPSCAGGHATGTHVHIARKFNGEWMIADSALPFVLSGWIVHNGNREYLGTLTKGNATVTACECGDAYTSINGGFP